MARVKHARSSAPANAAGAVGTVLHPPSEAVAQTMAIAVIRPNLYLSVMGGPGRALGVFCPTKSFLKAKIGRRAIPAHLGLHFRSTGTLGISRWKNMAQINNCGRRAAEPYKGLTYWDYNWRKGGAANRMIGISKRKSSTSRNIAAAPIPCAIRTLTLMVRHRWPVV